MSVWYFLLLLGVATATLDSGASSKAEESTEVDNVDKRARNPYSWMAINDLPARNPYSWTRNLGKRAPSRNPYSWMATKSHGKRAARFGDDYGRAPRNPYSWQYTMFDKRTRNPYSWMNEY